MTCAGHLSLVISRDLKFWTAESMIPLFHGYGKVFLTVILFGHGPFVNLAR